VSLFIVTVRLPKSPGHDPQRKQYGECWASDVCTDATGEHHSFLATGTSAAGVLAEQPPGLHVTRIEKARWKL